MFCLTYFHEVKHSGFRPFFASHQLGRARIAGLGLRAPLQDKCLLSPTSNPPYGGLGFSNKGPNTTTAITRRGLNLIGLYRRDFDEGTLVCSSFSCEVLPENPISSEIPKCGMPKCRPRQVYAGTRRHQPFDQASPTIRHHHFSDPFGFFLAVSTRCQMWVGALWV